ncbi:ATPase, T2SS/T4P/T4SS family [Crenobacter sp. SG2305]|uniref:GspE/PulE family protein n=1 Tax=Crenobacter oryzisoli TaxID=3056844 RepID=UPI0025AA7E77|nr:ATPase, T2SS/T4P/T4SS family [Crenobacter sp. SG2305]MDN0082476.1 ATPase, T2SS/T4P/T4SS family [Crenobacter sp. SG2305]
MSIEDKIAAGEVQLVQLNDNLIEDIPDSCKAFIALTNDGTLLVSDQKTRDIEFLSLRTRWISNGVIKKSITIEDSTLNKILSDTTTVLSSNRTKDNQPANDMQKQALAIIDEAIAVNASDIHIEKKNEQTRIYFRVNGDLDPESKPRYRNSAEFGIELMRCIYQAMTDISNEQFSLETPQDASFRRDILPDSLFGARIAHAPIFGGHYMVLRMLYRGNSTATFEELGFDKSQIKALDYMMRNPYGIILFGGITGSGKTTSIACALAEVIEINDGAINVLTTEDPVEFIIQGARQMAVTGEGHEERDKAYKSYLKAMMRMDPDVAMISELRDSASVMQAIQLALTGHQVWTTVHAIDTTIILPRLTMMGVSTDILADNHLITGLISQSLVKKLCPHCKQPIEEAAREGKVDRDYLYELNHAGIETDKVFIRGNGCHECGNLGHYGRTVLAEVVIPDATYMNHFRNGDRVGMRHHAFDTQRWMSRHQHARAKIGRGEVDPRDVEKTIGPITRDMIEADNVISIDELRNAGHGGAR